MTTCRRGDTRRLPWLLRAAPTFTARTVLRPLVLVLAALAFGAAPSLAQQELLLPNPGFEAVDDTTVDRDDGALPARWRARGFTFDGHRLTNRARSGRHAARIHFEAGREGSLSGYYYSEPQPLPPCSEVRVSAWVNVRIPADQQGEHKGAFLRLMFERDEEYVRLLNGRAVGDTGGEWRRLQLSGTPPPEADSWRMSVEFKGIGTARFDDCSAGMTPLATLPGARIDAPTQEAMELGGGRYGMLGPAREAAGDMRAVTTIAGQSALPPRIHLGVVWYRADGTQLGVHQKTARAWRRATEVTLSLRSLAAADTVRAVAYAESRDEWAAASVEPPELAPLEEDALPRSDVEMTGHPRLFITADHLQRLRELVAMDRDELAARHPHFAHHLEVILRDADRCFDEDEITVYSGRYSTTLPPAVPRRHDDNFPYWTGLSREIERRIEKLATAYLLTGERRYADLCAEWTLALCEWPAWTDPDYGARNCCLDTGHFCHAVAFAYDFLHDVLTPAERETIRRALLEKGAAAVMRDATEGWAQRMSWPNGFAVVMGGMGIAGVATLGDDPAADEYVQYSRRRLHEFLDTRDRDGGYVEGHTYGGYAMSHIMPFAGTLAVHGDDALVSHPYLPKTLRLATVCLDPMSATSVNFCDSSYSARAYRSMAAWLARSGNATAAWYLAHNEGLTHTFRYVPPIGLLWLPLDASAEAPAGRPAGAHYRDIGWTVARSGFADEVTPGEPALLFAMRSGPFGSHCQLDSNSFMLNVNGRWLLRDPGYGRDATAMHSTLLVDGEGQLPADAHVAAFGNVGRIVYAVGDASACYDLLSDFRRHAVMVDGRYVMFFDEIRAAEPGVSIASQLVTDVAEPEIDGACVRLTPQSDDAAANEQFCTVVLADAAGITTEQYQDRAKVIQHHDGGGLFPALLWPHAREPAATSLHAEGGDVALVIIDTGDETEIIVLNLTGEYRSVEADDGSTLATDARLVWVRRAGGEVEDLSMVRGSRLELDGEVLVELDAKQDLAR